MFQTIKAPSWVLYHVLSWNMEKNETIKPLKSSQSICNSYIHKRMKKVLASEKNLDHKIQLSRINLKLLKS